MHRNWGYYKSGYYKSTRFSRCPRDLVDFWFDSRMFSRAAHMYPVKKFSTFEFLVHIVALVGIQNVAFSSGNIAISNLRGRFLKRFIRL